MFALKDDEYTSWRPLALPLDVGWRTDDEINIRKPGNQEPEKKLTFLSWLPGFLI
jgi:hypothetical protein